MCIHAARSAVRIEELIHYNPSASKLRTRRESAHCRVYNTDAAVASLRLRSMRIAVDVAVELAHI